MEIQFKINLIDEKIGFGIISAQNIKKGDIIYSLSKDINAKIINDTDLEKYILDKFLNLDEKKNFFYHAFCFNYSKCVDLTNSSMRYMNHSINPNSEIDENGNSYSIKDINIGEEILEDYRTYKNPLNYTNLCKFYIDNTISNLSLNF